MVFRKKLLLLLTSAALLSACGGGGGGGGDPAVIGGGDNASGGGGAPIEQPGSGTVIPATDQQLNGYLQIGGNAVIYIPGDRELLYDEYAYNATYIEPFETGRMFTGEEVYTDIAAGLTEEERSNPALEIRPEVAAPAAPIASFGFRVVNEVQSEAGGIQTGAQSVIGRVAFDFVERSTTAAGNPERMTFIIDNVELGTNTAGRLITARARGDAQVYVSGVNAAGTAVNATIPAAVNSVRLMPLSYVLDNYGDTSAQVLLIDLEQAFSQAGERLAALHNVRGDFDMHVTLSSLKMVRPEKIRTDPNDPDPAWPRRDLVGKTIEMNGHAPVAGAGVSGRVWVRGHVNPR
jgi:hypothetical protein